MRILKQNLIDLVNKSKSKDLLLKKVEEQNYEYVYVALQDEGLLSFDKYQQLKTEFEERNKYLPIIKITSPRAFGETWAEDYILSLFPQLQSSRKNKLVKEKGQYDVFYDKGKGDIVRVEVKAGRAVDRNRHNMPYDRRAFSTLDEDGLFDMNFQQMKPDCFDVAILMGVWTDKIRYWVLSSKEMRGHKHFSSGQHRGNKGYEGQIHIKTENLNDFKPFEVEEVKVFETVLKKAV